VLGALDSSHKSVEVGGEERVFTGTIPRDRRAVFLGG